MYNILVEKNPHLPLYPVSHETFQQFGRVLEGIDFTSWIRIMEDTAIPPEGNVYVADEQAFAQHTPYTEIRRNIFGNMPMQVGYCNGNGDRLNALEYHKTPEVNVAVSDLVLLLADTRDIVDNQLDSGRVKGYYLPAGTACELYGTTLHFAPCKVQDSGFRCVVVLPQGVNAPLEPPVQGETGEAQLLWMRGKWLIAHPESIPASKGACAGIMGENIAVHY